MHPSTSTCKFAGFTRSEGNGYSAAHFVGRNAISVMLINLFECNVAADQLNSTVWNSQSPTFVGATGSSDEIGLPHECGVPKIHELNRRRNKIMVEMVKWLIVSGIVAAHAAVVPQNANDRTSGRPVSFEDLVGLVDVGISEDSNCSGVSLSPDGKYVAVQTTRALLRTNSVELHWVIVPVSHSTAAIDLGDGGEPIPLIFHGWANGNSVPQTALWSPNSQWIAYRVERNGEIQLWRSKRDGTEREQLTKNAADVKSFRWAADGKQIVYSVGSRRGLAAGLLNEEGYRGYYFDDRFSPVLSRAPLQDDESTPSESEHIWAYDVERRSERPATDAERLTYGLPDIQSVPGGVQGKCERKAKTSRVRTWLKDLRVDQSEGIVQPLTVVASRGSGDAETVICTSPYCTGHFKGIWMDDDGQEALFLRWLGPFDYGQLALYRWEIGTSRVKEMWRTDDLLEACARAGEQLICAHEAAVKPRALATVDLKTGAIARIFDPNPGFRSLGFGEVTPEHWKAQNGVEGFGHLVKPIGYDRNRRYPLVIVQYRSRGFLRGGVGDEYPIHVFAANGFAVLSFHRPDDWESFAEARSYEEAQRVGSIGARDRQRILSTLEAGIDYLDHLGVIDPKRVGITGLSDGAETATFAIVNAPDRFAAAVTSADWWNPILFYLIGPKHQQSLRNNLLFDDPARSTASEQWQRASVALNAQNVRTPLLMQVADSEFLPATQSFTELRQRGKPVEMYIFPNEHHIKSQPMHRFNIYKRSVQWFKFWLQDTEDSDPVDAGQYDRWRQLRTRKRTSETPAN
jgi:dipeptidyl aminopeptidase/acylaminoacyl peptidase